MVLCGDYRSLNQITVRDRYPIPYLQDFSNNLWNKKIFSKIDLFRAYLHVPVKENDIPKTAITLPFGLFEFLFMPFGLCNAAQTFQRLMHEVCKDLDFIFVYLDDITIASDNVDQHEQHLRILFQRLKDYGLSINIKKCELEQGSIVFLRHKISQDGMKLLETRIKVIQEFPKPTIAKDLKRFLNTINFYRRFIPNAVKHQMIVQAMIDGNKKNEQTPLNWTEDTSTAFEKCKQDLP